MIAVVVRVSESGGSVGSLVRSIASSSESDAAPSAAPDWLVIGLKHGAGAAGSGDQLPESASSAIGGAHQPRLWSPAVALVTGRRVDPTGRRRPAGHDAADHVAALYPLD